MGVWEVFVVVVFYQFVGQFCCFVVVVVFQGNLFYLFVYEFSKVGFRVDYFLKSSFVFKNRSKIFQFLVVEDYFIVYIVVESLCSWLFESMYEVKQFVLAYFGNSCYLFEVFKVVFGQFSMGFDQVVSYFFFNFCVFFLLVVVDSIRQCSSIIDMVEKIEQMMFYCCWQFFLVMIYRCISFRCKRQQVCCK